ncbi:hypothetical protein RhiirA1_468673 [Rhizophagus irregularis]|uniref:SAM domain-containing protein n=1 Tax=Rhizophagus irregularis TaxID=588596 RepID=A0A2N0R9J4_9GLOM|nr:hypothetical protein RhiirA1_468673 [Rhizophagus irregularis]CAB4474313.1 unnamed protein product [Rhizophagus irregularis]
MTQKKSNKKKSSRVVEEDTDIGMEVSTPKFEEMSEGKSSTVVSTDSVETDENISSKSKKSSKKKSSTKEKSKHSSSSKQTDPIDVGKSTETVSSKKSKKSKKKSTKSPSNVKENPEEPSLTEVPTVDYTSYIETVEEIEKLNRNDLINYLKNKKELDLDKQDINTIKSAKFTGQVLLDLTQYDLEKIGLALGPAKAIVGLIKTLKGEEEQVTRKRKYEEPQVVLSDIIKIAVKEEFSRQKSEIGTKSAKVENIDYPTDLPTPLYKRVKVSEEFIPKTDDEDKVAEMSIYTSTA